MYDARVSDVTDPGLTIDQLAQRTGMTVRNIRAHQSRGLLPSPEVRGRTGYYTDEHTARLELIKELQADGFNLEAIRRLLAGVGDASSDVLNFSRALRAPFEDEAPEIVEAAELAERFGGEGGRPDPGLLKEAERLGLLRPLGEGRFEVISPRLQRAGAELAALGVPPEKGLEVLAKIRRHSRGVARTFVELFIETIWEPFDRAGRPEDEWPRVLDAIERLRPLASDALLSVFQMVMSDAVEETAARELVREARRPSSGRNGRGRRGRGRRRSSHR
jgi:DNA-binding transcriptional MerR regulator